VVATGKVTKLLGDVYWFKAPADPTGEWQKFEIERGATNSYFKVYTMDANGDGKQDIIVGGTAVAVLFINPGDPTLPGAVWQKVTLPQGTGSTVYLDDINGDGRLDIVNTLLHGNVSWVDMLYQDGEFVFNRTVIDSNLDGAFDANCLDVNGDSKKDVLVSTFQLPDLYWYEQPADSQDPWIQHVVTNTYDGTDLYTGDINADGKDDFVISGLFYNKISWFSYTWENNQAVWTEHIIDDNVSTPGDNSLNDIDGDGDLDVIVTSLGSNAIVWYENKLTTTVIELSEFTAVPGALKVTVQWVTESEIDNAGFNLYRSTSENGEYTKINVTLIPAGGSATQGASYEFVDKDVKNREMYYYKLEDVDINGQSTFHGPVSATPKLMYGRGR